MYFSCNVSFSSLPVFLPTILTGMGYSSINAQGLTAPPHFLAFLVCIATTYIADRPGQRGLVIMIVSLIGAVGYTVLATVEATGPRYFAVYLVAAGIFPAIFNIAPWTLNNQGSGSARGTGIALLQMVGQCGPLLGTRLYPAAEGRYYVKGMSIYAGFMFLAAILALVLRQHLVWENKKADEREAAQTASMRDDEKIVNVASENSGLGSGIFCNGTGTACRRASCQQSKSNYCDHGESAKWHSTILK
jgi:dipeptide/tripeptide permease